MTRHNGNDPNFGESCLTLGWEVTLGQDPRYWLSAGSKAGLQPADELVSIPTRLMGTHTAIIAQSGSGKSFFLGRIIEEIMLQTSANCLIFDPNADFRRVHETVGAKLWTEATYDPLIRKGKLPHETSREQFASRWEQIPIRIRTSDGTTFPPYEPIQIWWPSLSMAFLAEDLDPMLHSDLYHCHAFVQDFGRVFELKYGASDWSRDFLAEAQDIFDLVRALSKQEDKLRRTLTREYGADEIIKEMGSNGLQLPRPDFVFVGPQVQIPRSEIEVRAKRFIDNALLVADDVSPNVERFYFGKAHQYKTSSIIRTTLEGKTWEQSPQKRLDVIDLPSLEDNARLLAINSILTSKWNAAQLAWRKALNSNSSKDSRTPTFIVVDEAHNLIPSEPRSKAAIALREQFRTIVAEGRKYGLFLILVSQRPDKLDPLILSECENKAVMRLGSASILEITCKMLGLEDVSPKLLQKCLEFETGRVLLAGAWSPNGPKIAYAAARRTVEGGRSLREDHWSIPREIMLLDLSPEARRAAVELKRKHPEVVFTCGHRTIDEQVATLAMEIAKNRGWRNARNGAYQKIQNWLDENPTIATSEDVASGLKGLIRNMSHNEWDEISPHLTGRCFDIQPPLANADQIKADIQVLRLFEQLLENEDGNTIWHIQFENSSPQK
jgi:hypothetical protein